MTRRAALPALVLSVALVAGSLGPAAAAAARSMKPGGLAVHAAPAALAAGVHIVKRLTGPSCTRTSSQRTPPGSIRVLVHASDGGTPRIRTVPFEQYVDNVLPNEWIASWRGEALKAGAVAVKNYGWFWVVHYGGYYGDTPTADNCFDVTDDTNFQVYRSHTAVARTNDAVRATWNVVADMSDQLVQTSYRASLTTSGPERCGAGANGSTLSQYGSQACANAGLTFQQILRRYYYPDLQLVPTTPGLRQLLTADDFGLHGRSSRAVFNPRSGNWAVKDVAGIRHFGTAGDLPAVTNQGDGWANIGVFRPSTGTWYSRDVFGRVRTLKWGTRADVPVQAHYDGITEPSVDAVFRPSTNTWWIHGRAPVPYGAAGDIPVPGHYVNAAADGYADHIAVFRPATGTWYIKNAHAVQFGTRGDIPVPGDYDGNGTTDLAVYRPATQTWYVRGRAAVKYGTPGDIPVTGDFSGAGRTDLAVFRPSTGTWYVRGRVPVEFGSASDIPIGRAPFRD